MSNSKRKTPIISNSCSGRKSSEKEDKQIVNRDMRRTNKILLNDAKITKDLEDIILIDRVQELSEIWSMKKDGKHYFGKMKGSDELQFDPEKGTLGDYFKELMRK